MKRQQLVSVIMPIYNVEKYLRDCLDSIANQTYRDFEVIMINDGSTDRSKQICEEMTRTDSRFKLLNQKNHGVSYARNVGLRKASGSLITFIDPDDYVDRGYIECLVKLLLENGANIAVVKQHLVYSDSKKRVKNDGQGKTKEIKIISGMEAVEDMLYQKEVSSSLWGKLFEKNFFVNFVFFDDIVHEDLLCLYYCMQRVKKVVIGDARLYYYRQRSDSLLSGKEFTPHTLDILKVMDRIGDDVDKNNRELERAFISRKLNAEMFVIRQLPNSGFEKCREKIREDIKKNRMAVLTDCNTRMKTKIGIIISFFGFSLMGKMYKILDHVHVARRV